MGSCISKKKNEREESPERYNQPSPQSNKRPLSQVDIVQTENINHYKNRRIN